MKAVYTHSSFIPDQDVFNVWYALLNDLSYEELNTAIQKHMMTNPHPPTIADLREAVALLS
jgi:Loader and inhibitor of phage G40P.